MRITSKNEHVETTIDINLKSNGMPSPMVEVFEELARDSFERPISMFTKQLAAIVNMGMLTPVLNDILVAKLLEASEQALEIIVSLKNGTRTEEEILFQHILSQMRADRGPNDSSDASIFKDVIDKLDLDDLGT